MTAASPTTGEYVASPKSAKGRERDRLCVRDLGAGASPLVPLQHFRGNLDNRDPALIDALASGRRVVTADNAGVGGSTGMTPSTVTQMAIDAIAFLEAMEFDQVDMRGFSIGSFVAQEIALVRPAMVRHLVSRRPPPGRRRHARLGA
jgi:pimeloyl-ACP methyl ester carboxylesterase